MNNFIPYQKLSKKKQSEISKQKRVTWQMNPVTRKPQNPKAYDRKKSQRQYDEYQTETFILILS